MESVSAPVRSSGRPSRSGDKDKDEKTSIKLKIPPPRTTPYKEKFQALRERYDQVVKAHDNYQRDLDIADAKIKRLQEENDLLLDAINVSSPDLINSVSPSILGLNTSRPTPDAQSRSGGIDNGHTPRQSSYHASHPSQANGSSNGRSNGSRHRPADLSDRESFMSDLGA